MQEHRHICPVCRQQWQHIKPDCEERFGSKCPACRAYDREPQLETLPQLPRVVAVIGEPPVAFDDFLREWKCATYAVMSGGKVGRA